jgi:hypothetical protein
MAARERGQKIAIRFDGLKTWIVKERVVFNAGPTCEKYFAVYPKAYGFVNFNSKKYPVYKDGKGGLYLEQTDTPFLGAPLSRWGRV